METLADRLQSLNINNGDLIIKDNNHPLDTQKCFISDKLFQSLTFVKTPGQTVAISTQNNTLVCRIYPRTTFPDDIIEINSSVTAKPVECLNNLKVKISDIKIIKEVPVYHHIEVKIVLESLLVMRMYYDDKELINILKQNILKLFVLKDRCFVSMEKMPQSQRMGISKVEILRTEPPGIGKTSSRTKVVLCEKLTQFQYKQLQKEPQKLFSLDRHLERLTKIIKLNEEYTKKYAYNCFPPTKQVLLVGPSGCGKSSLVHVIGGKTRTTVVNILGHEVNKSNPGETESSLRDTFNTAFEYAKLFGKCIINLEEVDNLCPRMKGSASHVQRAVSQLLNLLDEAQTVSGIFVIGTTNKPDSVDPSVRRHGRLETEIYMAPPTEQERANIFKNFIKDQAFIDRNMHEALCEEIASMTPGYVGADLQLLCNTVSWKAHRGLFHREMETLNFWRDEFRKVIANMSPASLKSSLGTVTTHHFSFDDLAGVGEIRKSLEMSVIWPMTHASDFARLSIPRPKGVLLYGPPGCAKTSLVRALVGLGTFTLLSISAAELYSPYVGDAERLVRQLFQKARQNSPCIFFIDEIDALAGSRGEKNQINSEVQDRIIATLLTQMDGVGHKMLAADLQHDSINNDDGVIVIGATNRPDMVDAALLRPGRFDKHIFVPPPNYDARIQILKCVTKTMPLQDVDFEFLAKSTELYSGADIKNICTEAALLAMTEDGMDVTKIRDKHFKKAFQNSHSSITLSQLEQYMKFESNKLK